MKIEIEDTGYFQDIKFIFSVKCKHVRIISQPIIKTSYKLSYKIRDIISNYSSKQTSKTEKEKLIQNKGNSR